jgi:hypothetical protein
LRSPKEKYEYFKEAFIMARKLWIMVTSVVFLVIRDALLN